MASTSKTIIAYINKGDKLNENNYEIWSIKIQYVFEELETLKALSLVLVLEILERATRTIIGETVGHIMLGIKELNCSYHLAKQYVWCYYTWVYNLTTDMWHVLKKRDLVGSQLVI